MSENKIKVSASTTSKAVRVNVSTPTLQGTVALSQDTSAYNAKIAEQWAISENIVLGKDYSSKYYANKAKESASNAQGISESVKSDYNEFLTASLNANEQLQTGKEEALTSLESARADAENSINNTKTTAISDIEFIADGEKQEIQGLVDDEKEGIKDLINTGKYELKESIGDVKILTTLEIGDIGFTQMAIDETKGKRRKLNGQLIIQEQYTQFTNIIKNSVALNPDLACTESEWQTAVTMSTNGVCYKFVIDDNAGTIRLPKYPTYFDINIDGNKTVSVYGNGKTLGLTDGTNLFGLTNAADTQINNRLFNKNAYGTSVGSTATANYVSNALTYGITTDSSKSGITGKVAISSEKIKGQYFIQVATGAETEDNIINEIELNNPFSLLDYKFSEYELNNLSWLRSNGQHNSKAVYPAVYDLLLKIYNGTETKAGVSVKLSTEAFTDYDFVLNTAEETFRLPIKVKLASGKAVVGNGIAIGLTDGTSYGGLTQNTDSGAFAWTSTYGLKVGSNRGSGNAFTTNITTGLTTDPAKSGLELSDSNLYLYFYVGETVQNANLINAGRIEEVVSQIKAEKLDKSSVKAYIVESYVNGTSWYRIWSDKWCEQGGVTASVVGGASVVTSYLKTFKNTNYTLLAQGLGAYTAKGEANNPVSNKQTSNFTLYSGYNGTKTFSWYASGYIN